MTGQPHKSCRCYVSFEAFNEDFTRSLFRHGDVNVVPSIGMYSTETRPFGTANEYMENLDSRRCLSNEPNVGRLKLVPSQSHALSIDHLSLLYNGWHKWRTACVILESSAELHQQTWQPAGLSIISPCFTSFLGYLWFYNVGR